MVDSQEIIERSFYFALLEESVKKGLSLNPDSYDFSNEEEIKRYAKDKTSITKEKGFFIDIYGVGNNQSKGMKLLPRFVIENKGFFPGEVGFPKKFIEKEITGEYSVSEVPYEAIDQYINVRVVVGDINQLRVLQKIMYKSIPQRGYLKPYLYEKAPKSGNIYIQAINFYDEPNNEKGIIEKVYVWSVQDTLLDKPDVVDTDTPIKEIHLDISSNGRYLDGIFIP